MSAPKRNPAEAGTHQGSGDASAGEGAAQRPGQAARDEQFERQGVLNALEAGLNEALPGLEVLDRNLEFDGSLRADLAVVDPLGRLLLVLVAREDSKQALLDTLDVLGYLRRSSVLLMRHLASRQVDERLEPRVVLIDSSNDALLAERMLALRVAGVRLYGVRTVRSSGSERSYLVPHGEELSGPEDAQAEVQAFLGALPAAQGALATDLCERLNTLDEELCVGADEQSLIWRLNGLVIARLECSGEALRASIAPEHRSHPIAAPEDVDQLLEAALSCLMDEYKRSEAEAKELPSGLGAIPGAATDSLLTDEEIRAFHG